MDIISFKALPNVHAAIIPIANHETGIFSEELASQNSTTPKRLAEFTSGRHLVHALQEQAGVSRSPVLRHPDRSPIWPQGCTGSISHSAQLAAAALTLDSTIAGLGIDIEARTRLNERLRNRLFTTSELQHIPQLEPLVEHADVLTFSAKEAVYLSLIHISEPTRPY